jgi:CHAT domain-containing protein
MHDAKYLVESKPVHTALSVTVYAELRKARRAYDLSEAALVAFGDPRFPRSSKEQLRGSGDSELRMASERGLDFASLPFSRSEVEGITHLFEGHSRAFLGDAATEEAAKSLGPDVQFLHFATHAVLDERIPLNSAIVLSIPDPVAAGSENGLLQAWEISGGCR